MTVHDSMTEIVSLPVDLEEVLRDLEISYRLPSNLSLPLMDEISKCNSTTTNGIGLEIGIEMHKTVEHPIVSINLLKKDEEIDTLIQKDSVSSMGFLQDVASFLVNEKLQEGEIIQNTLRGESKWLIDTCHYLKQLKENLLTIEQELTQIEKESTEASLKTEVLNHGCAQISDGEKHLTDFITVVEQRTEYFDRLEKLRDIIGTNARDYIANLTTTDFTDETFVCHSIQDPNIITINSFHRLYTIFVSIDDACSYFKFHSDFSESGDYLQQFQRLRDDLLLGIRQVVHQTIERCETQAIRYHQRQILADSDEIVGSSRQSGFHFTSLYARFRTAGQHIQPLLRILYQRSKEEVEGVYSNMLDLLEGVYISTRLRLISDFLKNQFNAIIHQHGLVLSSSSLMKNQEENDNDEYEEGTTLPLAVRQAVTFCISVGQLELQTFVSIFIDRTPNIAIDTLMESIGDILLSVLRPLVLQSGLLQELRDISESLSLDILDTHSMSHYHQLGTGVLFQPKEINHLNGVYSTILKLHKDVQERMIFKAESYILTKIRGFEPQLTDLMYPDILFEKPLPKFSFFIAANNPLFPATHSLISQQSGIQHEPLEDSEIISEDAYVILSPSGGWYPPLRDLSQCLAAVGDVVTPPAFQGLCQHAVDGCIAVLFDATDKIKELKASSYDANLFLIKHLLMLREQIAAFNCDLIMKETFFDFTGIKSRIRQFLRLSHSSQDISRNFSEGLTLGTVLRSFMPELQENRVDTKRHLEVALKQHCESFVAHCSALTLLPLLRLSSGIAEVTRVHRHASVTETQSDGVITPRPLSLNIQILHQFTTQFRESLIVFIPRVFFNLEIYLCPVTPTSSRQVELHPFPIELPTNRETLRRKSGSPQKILSSAMRFSILEVVRHVQSSILEFEFFENSEKSGHFKKISLEELKKDFGWWTEDELSLRFDYLQQKFGATLCSSNSVS